MDTAAYPCAVLTVVDTHIEPFQFIPPGFTGVIGQLAGVFPEYQPPTPEPEAPPNTLDEFHWVR